MPYVFALLANAHETGGQLKEALSIALQIVEGNDLDDIILTGKSSYSPTALSCCYHYNNTTKKRAYYMAPMKLGSWPFHFWRSLVEKTGYKRSDIPNTWDAFLDFFMPVQDKLRAGCATSLPTATSWRSDCDF
jgi:hypothetical protein